MKLDNSECLEQDLCVGGMCVQGKAKILSIYVGGMGMGADGYFGDLHKILWSFLCPVG